MRPAARRGWTRSICRAGAALMAAMIAAVLVPQASGDGFHNAALATRSLDEWLSDVRQAVPDLDLGGGVSEMESGLDLEALKSGSSSASSPRRSTAPRMGGSIDARLTPQQQALLARKANDCLEILAYMDRQNIYPREFPTFDLSKIPHYRQAARQLLGVMGPEGTRQVAGRIRQELMRGLPMQSDVSLHSSYHDEMVKLLAEGVMAGHLSDQEMEDLRQAIDGATDPAQRALADKVRQAISPENMSLEGLAKMASRPLEASFKQRVLDTLRKRQSEAGVLELLRARGATTDLHMQRRFAAELAGRRPSYAELKDQLAGIWQLAGSPDRQLAAAARGQVAVAFQRAPISHCLYWLGEADSEMTALIWQQVDARIKRADAARRTGYAETGIAVLKDQRFGIRSREAAIDLLKRLEDRRAAKDVSEDLIKLPRELWPSAGRLLHDLTGEDFGPHEGDGIAQALEASKQWQAWCRENLD